MEKIKFFLEDNQEAEEFFVLEQTTIGGNSYLLVADSETDDAECMILKDTGDGDQEESVFAVVESETELNAVLKVFEELLEDVTIEK